MILRPHRRQKAILAALTKETILGRRDMRH